MSKTTPDEESPIVRLTRRIGRLADSRLVGWLVNLPPIAWVMRVLVRTLAKRRGVQAPAEEVVVERVARAGLDATLHQIVYDVVNVLGYAVAMVATYEQGDSLTVRALYVDPGIASEEKIRRWEQEVSKYSGRPLSLTDPDIARVFVYKDEYKDNLSVRAVEAGAPVVSDDLYDLFIPIAPSASKPLVQGIQQDLGIRQCIAVPFFLEAMVDGQSNRETVGNLFAAKRGEISEQDELILSAFGRQAASAIESERRRLQIQVSQELVFMMQSNLQDEEQILWRIVQGVVSDLGYVGAMVATYEQGGSMPVRALYVDPGLATEEQIHQWEQEVSKYYGRPLSLTDPEVARIFVYQDEYKDNLSVRAVKAGVPVVSDDLYDLFVPIAPLASKPFIQGVQQGLGIRQCIAVPFFLETMVDGQFHREVVGNLFAATRSRGFSSGEITLLQAFGQQAAAGIRNARLYRKAEERRQVAQIFGKMAFSASAYVHDLRNHIGAFRGHFHLLQLMDQLAAEDRQELLASNSDIAARLDAAAEILDNLHEPWRQIPDDLTDVNGCIKRAIGKVIPDISADIPDQGAVWTIDGINVRFDLSPALLPVTTSSPMLVEAFKVLTKNALEAIREKGRGEKSQEKGAQGGELRIESHLAKDDGSAIEVVVCDNGVGIEPENLKKVFEMRWTTKGGKGMGFGLFWTRDYIEGLGGSIEAESVWEKGTTFRVRLPIGDRRSEVS